MTIMEKHIEIVQLLDWLRDKLGPVFAATDHWESDLRSIGLSTLGDPSQLMYVSSLGANRYFVELESAPSPSLNVPFRVAGTLTNHLKNSNALGVTR
jgi:hypothetical protein